MFRLSFISLPFPSSSTLPQSCKEERSLLVTDCSDLDEHQSRTTFEPEVSEIAMRSCLGTVLSELQWQISQKPHQK